MPEGGPRRLDAGGRGPAGGVVRPGDGGRLHHAARHPGPLRDGAAPAASRRTLRSSQLGGARRRTRRSLLTAVWGLCARPGAWGFGFVPAALRAPTAWRLSPTPIAAHSFRSSASFPCWPRVHRYLSVTAHNAKVADGTRLIGCVEWPLRSFAFRDSVSIPVPFPPSHEDGSSPLS